MGRIRFSKPPCFKTRSLQKNPFSNNRGIKLDPSAAKFNFPKEVTDPEFHASDSSAPIVVKFVDSDGKHVVCRFSSTDTISELFNRLEKITNDSCSGVKLVSLSPQAVFERDGTNVLMALSDCPIFKEGGLVLMVKREYKWEI